MKRFIEYVVNKAYRYYYHNYYANIKESLTTEWQERIEKVRKEHFISFSDFEFSHDWYGRKISWEIKLTADFSVNKHIIYLNKHFLFSMMGYQTSSNEEYTYEKFLETIAHEVAHCIIYDLYSEQKGHDGKHKVIAEELKNYLLTDKTMNILEKDWE